MNIDKFKGKMETKFSNHAKIRKQQRGIRKVEADLVFNFGDRNLKLEELLQTLHLKKKTRRIGCQ